MAKEFDIYLRKHLVEGDLLVYSIPYREGLSVTNRLIIGVAVRGYLLHKLAAANMGLEAESHIDQMLKLCLEKLSMGTQLGAFAGFETRVTLSMENAPTILGAHTAGLTGRAFNEAENGLVLASSPLITQVGVSAGGAGLPLLADTRVTDMCKTSLLRPKGIIIPDVSVGKVNQTDYIDASGTAEIGASMQSFCYSLTFEAGAGIEIMALVLGTEIARSLGVWYDGLSMRSDVTGTWAKKYVEAGAVTGIVQEAEERLIKPVYPVSTGINLACAGLDMGLKRFRLLSELDGLSLEDMDDMTLEELDYIHIV